MNEIVERCWEQLGSEFPGMRPILPAGYCSDREYTGRLYGSWNAESNAHVATFLMFVILAEGGEL